MNTDRKNFTGRLNSDIDERLFSLDKFRGDYSDAYNCLILSAIDSGIGLVKGFKGTTEVTTSYGNVSSKKVIGKCVDLPNAKIYYFISAAASANHAIYEVDVQTKTVVKVIQGAILKFSAIMRITGANVVDGKYLLYTDGVNEPRNIDIVRAKAGELTTELQILAAKQPPLEEPKDVTPVTDFTFLGNNIRGNFFQFKYRYIYKDKTKSTFSPISEISTMGGLSFPITEQQALFQNSNAISFKYNIPNYDITNVELAFRFGNTGDFAICDNINTSPSENYTRIAVQVLKTNTTGVSVTFINEFVSIEKTTSILTSLYDAAIDLSNQLNTSLMSLYASAHVDPDSNVIIITSKPGNEFDINVGDIEYIQKVTLLTIPIVGDNYYLFKNNKPLIALDVAESNLEYDRVPLKAEAQELVNGSNVVYGGITEGYDYPNVDISASVNTTAYDLGLSITTETTTSNIAIFTVVSTLFPITGLDFNDGYSDVNIFVIAEGTLSYVRNNIYNGFKLADPNIRAYSYSNDKVILLSNYNDAVTASSNNTASIRVNYGTNQGKSINYNGVPLNTVMPENSCFSVTLTRTISGKSVNYYYSYFSKLGQTLDQVIASFCDVINENDVNIVAYQVPENHLAIKIYTTDAAYLNADATQAGKIIESSNGLKNGDSYRYAIEYLDRTGKLSTVSTNQLSEINVPFMPENGVPNAVITVKSRPPVWAEKFQILRTKRRRVSSFLQYTIRSVTNSTSGNLLNLNFSNADSNLPFYNEKFGAKLSYVFATGDRIRFIRYKDGTPFQSHEDLPILSITTEGALQIPLPLTFEYDVLDDLKGAIVEVYTPNIYSNASESNELFYEIAMGGTIGNAGEATRYHIPNNKSGNDQTQSLSNPSTTPLIMYSVEGDVWYKSTSILDFSNAIYSTEILESQYQSDRYPIQNSNIGRANAFDKDARQLFRKATAYHSDAYYADSNVNNINRIYATSFKDYDQTFGAIKLFHLDGFMLYNFQENKVGTIPVNRQMVYNQDGSSSLILSSTLLNDCRYYDYVGGINNNPESFAYNQFNKYFVDIKNNAICKIGGNGIIKISEMGMKSYFTEMFNAYKSANVSLTTQKPRFYGAWDEDNSLYILCPEVLEQGENPNITYPAIVFNEVVSGWTSKLEIYPDCISGAFGEVFSWQGVGAKLWRHNSNDTRNLFYGVQKTRSITIVSALSPDSSKTYLTLIQEPAMLADDRYDSIYEANAVDPSIWAVPTISTSLGQASNLIVSDFEKKEGFYYGGFLRDTTTPTTNPLLTGDVLKGVWMKMTLTNSSTKDIGLYSTLINSVPSKISGIQ
jgi:hypothetical protein